MQRAMVPGAVVTLVNLVTAVTAVTAACTALCPLDARAEWQEQGFDVVAVAASGTALQPSLAAGVDHPDEEECALEPCALEEPVPVTEIAYVDTANGDALTLASRFGEVGAPWASTPIVPGPVQHPHIILDRDGGELITYLDMSSTLNRLRIARRARPGLGNCGPSASFFCRSVANGNITMPGPAVVQYHAANAGPVGAERRIHVVFSRDGLLWHAFLDEERFWAGAPFERYPVGAWTEFLSEQTEIIYDEDAVAGEWPAVAPVFATDEDAEPFNYEAFPGVAFDDGDVAFRRAREEKWYSSPMMHWLDRVTLSGDADQRPSIDTRHERPVVAWAPACSDAGGELRYRESKAAEPWDVYDWLTTTNNIAENACDPSLSVGKYGAPYVAYVEPGLGTIEVTARPFADKPWASPATIDDGAEPSMDYNPHTALQSLAYVEPSSGELRVVDGFWY